MDKFSKKISSTNIIKFAPYILKTARPRQWAKNFAIFAPLIFTGQLLNANLFKTTVFSFIIFCALASANYIFNDVLDAKQDRKHPFKKLRPVASRKLHPFIALLSSFAIVSFGLLASSMINPAFFVWSIMFIILEFSYSLILKRVVLIDILAITGAYFLRVYAGEAATGYHLSVWLTLAVISLSLFLAVGKRRAELTLLNNFEGVVPKDTRSTLLRYSEKLLDTYTAMTANATFITYSFYTFLERPPSSIWQYRYFLIEVFPPERKWLMLTIPFVLFGIMRYMQLIYEGQGESPEHILTSDLPLLSTVLSWGLLVVVIIYGIGG